MESSARIMEFFRGKSILITGSTGFLAKVFVEKLLRVQPGVKRLYLLIRAADDASAKQRMQSEIISKELFKVLKEKHGGGFESLVAEKLFPVAGDVVEQNLGIRDSHLLQILFEEVEIVVNVAATTNFYERYDVSLSINVIGAKHALQFAQNCERTQMLLHVSTAFVQVGAEQKGVVSEKKFEMGETLKRKPDSNRHLDIEEEVRLAARKKRELQLQGMSQEAQKASLKEFGRKRAKLFGWPNTYVFTKAMAEMLLGRSRGNTPLVILRPTVITSIYRDPLPGWIEGVKGIDSLIMGYARGKVSRSIADPKIILDLIPADMVVNAMIVTAAVHSEEQQQSEVIYHVGSSNRHPMMLNTLFQAVNDFFSKPHSERIKTKKFCIQITSALGFRMRMAMRYKLPLEAMHLVNLLSGGLLAQGYKQFNKSYSFSMLIFDLYKPYVFFKGRFDDFNLERLIRIMPPVRKQEEGEDETESGRNDDIFVLDPKSIGDWKDYFYNIHFPGILKSIGSQRN